MSETFIQIVYFSKSYARKQRWLFFCEHYVYYVFVFCILYVSCALFWTLDDDFSLSLRGCTGLTQA